MAARHSPPVQFPLRGAGILGRVMRLMMGGVAILLLAWVLLGAGEGSDRWLRGSAGALLWLFCIGCAQGALKVLPRGQLHWNGECWILESSTMVDGVFGQPRVLCDWGWGMALVWRAESGRHVHVWLQRNWALASWADVRRAVYLSAPSVRDPHAPGTLP